MSSTGMSFGSLLGMSAPSKRPLASLTGYLWKMKRAPKILSPQWNKRFFAIEGRKLKWYESELGDDVEKGCIDLRAITGVSRFEPGNRGVFSFIVCCPERNLLLRAGGQAEMDKWIRALQTQADRARGGSGMGVITGLFPSMSSTGNASLSLSGGGGGRGKSKPLPTLEKELDRIVQRLTFLESEIILNAEDIRVSERHPSRPPPNTTTAGVITQQQPLQGEESALSGAGVVGGAAASSVKMPTRSLTGQFEPRNAAAFETAVAVASTATTNTGTSAAQQQRSRSVPMPAVQFVGPRRFLTQPSVPPPAQRNQLADLVDFHHSDFEASSDNGSGGSARDDDREGEVEEPYYSSSDSSPAPVRHIHNPSAGLFGGLSGLGSGGAAGQQTAQGARVSGVKNLAWGAE